jgi:hypothetical protein
VARRAMARLAGCTAAGRVLTRRHQNDGTDPLTRGLVRPVTLPPSASLAMLVRARHGGGATVAIARAGVHAKASGMAASTEVSDGTEKQVKMAAQLAQAGRHHKREWIDVPSAEQRVSSAVLQKRLTQIRRRSSLQRLHADWSVGSTRRWFVAVSPTHLFRLKQRRAHQTRGALEKTSRCAREAKGAAGASEVTATATTRVGITRTLIVDTHAQSRRMRVHRSEQLHLSRHHLWHVLRVERLMGGITGGYTVGVAK